MINNAVIVAKVFLVFVFNFVFLLNFSDFASLISVFMFCQNIKNIDINFSIFAFIPKISP